MILFYFNVPGPYRLDCTKVLASGIFIDTELPICYRNYGAIQLFRVANRLAGLYRKTAWVFLDFSEYSARRGDGIFLLASASGETFTRIGKSLGRGYDQT